MSASFNIADLKKNFPPEEGNSQLRTIALGEKGT